MPKSESTRERQADIERGENAEDRGRRDPAEDAAEELPELSERGGVAPTERSPSEYHDRTRDRSLDEG